MAELTEQAASKQGRVLIFSGPSGVGKGTLLKLLFDKGAFPLTMSVSATTRAPRPGEIDGIHYYFLTREEFLSRQARGDFLESFEVYAGGAWYGTLRETVEQAVAEGKWIVLEIDVKGAKSVVDKIPEAVTFFIAPPTIDDLRKRLESRGSETAEELAKRVAQAQTEIDSSGFYRYHIVNDRLEDALAEVVEILQRNVA